MREFFLRQIPVNVRTVLFCFCAAGAVYPFCDVLLFYMGWENWGYWQPLDLFGFLLFGQILALPIVSLTLIRVSPVLTVLGFALFCLLAAAIATLFVLGYQQR